MGGLILGILGGTFNPVHMGHLIMADDARDQLALDRVLWVLTPKPPHKNWAAVIDAQLRLEMLAIAIKDQPAFEVSLVDINRAPPYYAVDTMQLLRRQYPEAQLIYLMGEDSLRDLPGWHQPDAFLSSCDGIGVMCRSGVTVDLTAINDYLPGVREKVRYLDTPFVEISASDIRKRVAQGRCYRYHLPSGVYDYIEAHQLYRA